MYKYFLIIITIISLGIVGISEATSYFNEVGNLTFPGNHSAHIYVSGDYAYCPLWEDGNPFFIVNVSDPTNPYIHQNPLPDIPNFAGVHEVCYANGYAYTCHRWGGVTMINVSDPDNPTVVSQANTTYGFHGLVALGNYLYYSEHSAWNDPGGLRIYNVSQGMLNEVGNVIGELDGEALVITSDEQYCYQSCFADDWPPSEMVIYDISNKNNPQIATTFAEGEFGGSYKMVISNDDQYIFMNFRQDRDS